MTVAVSERTAISLVNSLGRDAASEIMAMLSVGNVVIEGADPSGARDSYDAFVRALSRFSSVFVPEGTYLLSQKLAIPALKTLRGAGTFSTTISSTVASGEAISIEDGCHLMDFKLLGKNTVGTVGIKTAPTGARGSISRVQSANFGTGMEFSNAWEWDCFACLVAANVTYGVVFSGAACNAINFYGGHIESNGIGVYSAPSAPYYGNGFFGVTIEGNTTHGIHFAAGSSTFQGTHVHGCYFEANGTYDILLDNDALGFSFLGNVFLGQTTNGIVLNAGRNGTIAGCFFDCGSASIDVNNAACINIDVGNNTYADNAFSSAFDSGTRTDWLLNDERRTQRQLRIHNPTTFVTTAATKCDNIMLQSANTPGANAFGGSIGFGIVGDKSDLRRAAIAAIQTSADPDTMSLDLYVHDAAASNPLTLGLRIQHDLTCFIQGAIDHNGSTIGFNGAAPVAKSTGWAITNPSTRKTFDTATVTLPQLAEAVGTLIDFLKLRGDIGA